MDNIIKSMLIQLFPDSRPVSRFVLERKFKSEIIDYAIENQYIIKVGKNAIGDSPLYLITEYGRVLRDS